MSHLDKAKAAMAAAVEIHGTTKPTPLGQIDHLYSLVNYNLRLVEMDQMVRQNILLERVANALEFIEDNSHHGTVTNNSSRRD